MNNRRSLYDANSKYTEDASVLSEGVDQYLRPLFKEWAGQGFCPREIAFLMQQTVYELMLEELIQPSTKGAD